MLIKITLSSRRLAQGDFSYAPLSVSHPPRALPDGRPMQGRLTHLPQYHGTAQQRLARWWGRESSEHQIENKSHSRPVRAAFDNNTILPGFSAWGLGPAGCGIGDGIMQASGVSLTAWDGTGMPSR